MSSGSPSLHAYWYWYYWYYCYWFWYWLLLLRLRLAATILTSCCYWVQLLGSATRLLLSTRWNSELVSISPRLLLLLPVLLVLLVLAELLVATTNCDLLGAGCWVLLRLFLASTGYYLLLLAGTLCACPARHLLVLPDAYYCY